MHNSCNILWNCYEEFITHNSPKEYIDFRDIKSRPAESTMPLFWIKPYEYIALDSNNREYLKANGIIADNINNYNDYSNLLNQLKQKLENNEIKEKTIVDFSYNAWSMEKDDKNYWLIAPGENARLWNEFYSNNIIGIGWDDLGDYSEYKNNKEKFVSDFLQIYGEEKKRSSTQVWRFYKEIQENDYVIAKDGLYKILGIGIVESDYYFDDSRYEYKSLRKVKWIKKGDWTFPGQAPQETVTLLKNDKVKEIMDIINQSENEKTISLMNLLEVNKNLILHGAPGTGKTYTAKDIAAQMICGKPFSEIESGSEEEKLFNEQTEFVQFHPSYDYSDFVEGLRPIEGENTGDVGFERKDGVFKEFCGKALKSGSVIQTNNFDESWNNLIEYIRNEMSEGRLVKIGNWEYSVSKADSLKYQSVGTKSNYSFTITKENVYLAYQHKKGRPSGYFQKEMEDTVAFMQENFNLSPFSENSISPQKNTKLPYIFIIDEINRGEMSKIFGELFFSIDPDYRGTKGKVRTQYANMLDEQNDFDDALGITSSYGHFFVPENVYIIGTMNDIDRSVDSMDFAMRRRFIFVELKANECLGMLVNLELSEGISKSDILSKMTVLNEEIEKISGLSSAYHIGGSYFAKLSKYSDKSKSEAFECLWNNHLKPLITDYLRGLPNLETKLATFKNKYDAAGVVSEESDK